MQLIYLTPASISYLNQFLLALVITAYLGLRFFIMKRQQPSKQDRLLVVFFVLVTIFSLALFLDVSLLPTERLPVVFVEAFILSILLIALIQFAYHFPESKENQKFERWISGSESKPGLFASKPRSASKPGSLPNPGNGPRRG